MTLYKSCLLIVIDIILSVTQPAGVGYSIRSISGIHITSYYIIPAAISPSKQDLLVLQPRAFRQMDSGFLVRLEYQIPLSERVSASIRGNGYLNGSIAPMWGLHGFVNVRF